MTNLLRNAKEIDTPKDQSDSPASNEIVLRTPTSSTALEQLNQIQQSIRQDMRGIESWVRQYMHLIKEIKGENEEMTRINKQLQSDIDRAFEKITELNHEIEDLKEKLVRQKETADRDLKNYENLIEAYGKRIDELNAELKSKIDEINSLRREQKRNEEAIEYNRRAIDEKIDKLRKNHQQMLLYDQELRKVQQKYKMIGFLLTLSSGIYCQPWVLLKYHRDCIYLYIRQIDLLHCYTLSRRQT
jgi:chromosome segregation ATPase